MHWHTHPSRYRCGIGMDGYTSTAIGRGLYGCGDEIVGTGVLLGGGFVAGATRTGEYGCATFGPYVGCDGDNIFGPVADCGGVAGVTA
jgi:hypothetical protein